VTTLLEEIEAHLNASGVDQGISTLFRDTLGWNRPQRRPFTIQVQEPVNATITIVPVAQMAAIPVFRVAWPGGGIPTSGERQAVYRALAAHALEHVLCYVAENGSQTVLVWGRQRQGQRVELRTLPYETGVSGRTTIEQLAKLAFSLDEHASGIDLSTVVTKLDTAFDVEAVTKLFFREYARVFGLVEQQITGIAGDARRLFTQKLFNRLLFIRFLERKNWLKYEGRTDYLRALWDVHGRAGGGSFWG